MRYDRLVIAFFVILFWAMFAWGVNAIACDWDEDMEKQFQESIAKECERIRCMEMSEGS